jgi:hypothetical protein
MEALEAVFAPNPLGRYQSPGLSNQSNSLLMLAMAAVKIRVVVSYRESTSVRQPPIKLVQ